MNWINHTNVYQAEASLVPRYEKFVSLLNEIVNNKDKTENLITRRLMLNNHYNTIDSMLRTILQISQFNTRYKSGAKYLRHVYCSENKQIMHREFTDQQ